MFDNVFFFWIIRKFLKIHTETSIRNSTGILFKILKRFYFSWMFLNILPVLLKYLILYWSLCMSPLFEPRVDSRILAFFSTIFLEAHPRILFGNSPRIFFQPSNHVFIRFLQVFFSESFQSYFGNSCKANIGYLSKSGSYGNFDTDSARDSSKDSSRNFWTDSSKILEKPVIFF